MFERKVYLKVKSNKKKLNKKRLLIDIYRKNGPDGLCSLAGSSKTAPSILIFPIVLGARYSFYVKSIAIYSPQKLT